MKKAFFFISGISVLGYGLYRYFKKQSELLSNYEYKISGLNVKKINISEIAIDLTLRFTSKADFEATINKVYLDLFLDGINVGYVTQLDSFIIPARGSSDISLFVSINPQLVLKNIANILLGTIGSKDLMFSFSGYANIKSGFISATIPIKYESNIKAFLN